jgi:hypothetical protein
MTERIRLVISAVLAAAAMAALLIGPGVNADSEDAPVPPGLSGR